MKKQSFIIFGFILLQLIVKLSKAQCGLFEISMNEKITNSNFIIEGEVIAQNCFKSQISNKIFTRNTIKVYSVLKGSLPQNIEIITAGGKLNNEMEIASSLLSLHLGDIGMFFLNSMAINSISNQKIECDVYASAQGFIAYNLFKQSVFSVFNQVPNNKDEFYNFLQSNYQLKPTILFDTIPWNYSSFYNRLTVINNFTPNIINAGTNAEITINGFGFGSSRGNSKVLFENSNNGGFNEIAAEAAQYKLWSDTKIVVAVPQLAGTGKIVVNTGTTAAISNASLKVNYAIINTGSNDVTIYPPLLVARNANKGYVWNMNINFDADSISKANFMISFKKWRCKTFINWTLGKNTNINGSERDTLSVISFDERNELPAGVLGLCYGYYSGCSDDDWYVEEQDLLFKKSDRWHFGDEQIDSSTLDFQSVVLHELGHAHQLAHVINSSDLMHYSISPGILKRNIAPQNLEGAQWMMNKSQESDICDKKRMQLLDSDLCIDENFGYYATIAYPNPFTDFLNIDFYLTKDESIAVSLFDINGKLVSNYENKSVPKGFFPLTYKIPNQILSAGVYILQIEIGTERMIKKLIKE